MSNRDYTDCHGKKRVRTDEELVETFLTGYLDYYSGGELEHMRTELDNLRSRTGQLLLAINREAIIKFCEEA